MVLGGGVCGSSKYFMPSLLAQLRGEIHSLQGETLPRMPEKVFDLDNDDEFAQFAAGASRPIKVYGSEDTVIYDPMKRTGVIISKLGASKAISLGAYAFALSSLDNEA